ncbi:Fc.00g081820.m01.CDS01 [Cosmosporella sp. VM-42]
MPKRRAPTRLYDDFFHHIAGFLGHLDLVSLLRVGVSRGPLVTSTTEFAANRWNLIFKSFKWIDEVKKIECVGGSPRPCMIGNRREESAAGSSLLLLVSDWSGDSTYIRNLFFECLQDHTYDKENCIIRFTKGNITLYVHDIVQSVECLHVPDPSIFFGQGITGPFTYVTYCDKLGLEKLDRKSIVGIKGLLGKDAIREICSLKVEVGEGLSRYRTLMRLHKSTRFVKILENGDITGWRRVNPGEREWFQAE